MREDNIGHRTPSPNRRAEGRGAAREGREPTMPYPRQDDDDGRGRGYGQATSSATQRARADSRDAGTRARYGGDVAAAQTSQLAAPRNPRVVAGLLRGLQEENDVLRSQLLLTERERDRVARKLESALTQLTASQTVVRQQEGQMAAAAAKLEAYRRKERTEKPQGMPLTAVEGDAMLLGRLRERCEQLADRLLTTVRDQQLSQTAEVYFLLRTQQEERSFICDALEGLLDQIGVETPEEKAARRRGMYGEGGGGEAGGSHPHGGLRAGAVSQLAMLVTDAMQTRTAWGKLEKARARLALEQAAATVKELRAAAEKVTRVVFTTSTSLMQTLDASAIDDDADGAADEDDRARHHTSGAGVSQYSQHGHKDSRLYEANTSLRSNRSNGGSDAARLPASRLGQSLWMSSRLPEAADGAVGDLEWSSDVLKACVKGLSQTQAYIDAANEVLTVQPPNESREWRGVGEGGLDGEPSASLSAAASPEMARLLGSVLADLRGMARRSLRDRESITRRLASELQHHYDATKQYEQRIRMLEVENSRLLATAAKALIQEAGEVAREGPAATGDAPPPVAAQPSPRTEEATGAVDPSPTSSAVAKPFSKGGHGAVRGRSSTVDSRSASPPERQGIATEESQLRRRHGPLFPSRVLDKDSHGARDLGSRLAAHPYAQTRRERSRSGARSVSSLSFDEGVEASPLDIRSGRASASAAVVVVSSSDRIGRRSASLLSPAPSRDERNAALPLSSLHPRRSLQLEEGEETRRKPGSRAHALYRHEAAPSSVATTATIRPRGPQLSPSRRGGEGSSSSDRTLTGRRATSPYFGQDHNDDSTADVPSPPPKPSYGIYNTLAAAALAERQQQRLSQGGPGGEAALTKPTAPAAPPPSTRMREGTAAPQRHISSPERREPRATRTGDGGPSSSSSSASGSKAELLTSGSGSGGQRTPDVWRRIREGTDPPADLASPPPRVH